MALAGGLASCNDFLDKEPMSNVAPELYFTDASQLEAYANNIYADILPSHSNWSYGIFGNDKDTDNQIGVTAHDRFTPDRWKVSQSESDNWKFELIYRCNFFFSEVLPKFGEKLDGSENTIGGDLANVRRYIGEMYFLRACEYFKRYQLFGDFPTITDPQPDDPETLREASKRSPRNEVARFIIDDLDKAYTLLSAKEMATTRINKDVALLLKSRVALYEGTWLKYFKGTAFVPNGQGWPGASKDYNASYQFPSGNIDSEISYFLEQAMDASQKVAEAYKNKLTENTGVLQQAAADPANPYYDMFAQENLSSISEVLLWRQYARGLETHNVNAAAGRGNYRIGVTRGFVNNFLMEDGTPVYTHGNYMDGDSYYMGDKTVANVRVNRDSRLSVFLKEPGQKNISTEALLNYMEASYEKEGTLNSTARGYWEIIRERSNVDTDIDKTISLTIMSKEAENDWGAYSAGSLVDATLYNIRRERRCEFIAEGLRYMDLCRWRSMDQMIASPYHVEGFHLWNTPMESWYTDLKADGTSDANVSSKDRSEYLRPYERYSAQAAYNGMTWKMAHYLQPIMVKQFQVTATDGADVTTSTIYQNPYWPMVADQEAER